MHRKQQQKNKKAGENMTIPKKTRNKRVKTEQKNLEWKKELERKTQSMQECDNRNAPIG